MKITFFEVPKHEQESLQLLLQDHEVIFTEDKLDKDNLSIAQDSEIVSVFINSVLDQEVLSKLPKLKYIATRSTGYDNIDINFARSLGIEISNVPAYGSSTVAEFAFALLLNLSRKIHLANEKLKEDADFSIYNFRGFDLYGKTLGIIGTGKIGKNMARMALGFNMKVIAYDLYPDLEFAKNNNITYKTLDEVISESDVISLHAPYNKENHHLINKEKMLKMKKGIYIINTARGELIDTDALVWGLEEGIIAGAGLDVLEGERELKEELEILASEKRREKVNDYKTLFEDRVLINHKNVIVTPHIAFYSQEAESEILKTTVENIHSFVNQNIINQIK